MALYDTKLQGQLFSADRAKQLPYGISEHFSWEFIHSLRHTHAFRIGRATRGFFLAPVCGGGFTRIFRFRMSSDCGGAPSLLRRDGTAELVAWELVQVSLPSLRSLHAVLVAIVNRHVVRRVRAPPRNDVIFSQNLPTAGIMHC